MGKGFGENAHYVVAGVDTYDRDLIIINQLVDGVISHLNVFSLEVPDMVLSQADGSVIVAIERGGLCLH